MLHSTILTPPTFCCGTPIEQLPRPRMPLSQRASRRPPVSRSPSAGHAVRIIGGQWKRTPLVVANLEGLRPTPDRVREALFNWLGHFCGGSLAGLSALDLFAGSGALGFEAASRGALRVVLVESQSAAVDALRAVQAKLKATQIEILQGDALATARRLADSDVRFDLVFLDPPFHRGWIERALAPAVGALAASGLLYIEAETRIGPEQAHAWGLELLRADKAGQVFYHLLRHRMGPVPGESTSC